jgi:hypothetical protein
MLEPQRLTTLWTSTVCYRDSFIVFIYSFLFFFFLLFFYCLNWLGYKACVHSELINSEIWILQTVCRTPLTGDHHVAGPLPAENKRRETTTHRTRFENTIPVFERAKTFHALHRTVTVIGLFIKFKIPKYIYFVWLCLRLVMFCLYSNRLRECDVIKN